MAFDALKHRDVAEINRVFEWLVSLVACLALSVTEATKIYRMLKGADFYRGGRVGRIVDYGVTNVTVVSNHLAVITHVFAVMTTKTT